MKLWLVDVRDVSSFGLHGAVVVAKTEEDAMHILGVRVSKYRAVYLGEARRGHPEGCVLASYVI